MEIWLIVGQFVVSLVGGLIAAGLVVAIGGLGAIRRAQNAANTANDELQTVSDRLNRHIKRVASHTAVEAKAETRTLKEQAQAHLLAAGAPQEPVRRPSVFHLVR